MKCLRISHLIAALALAGTLCSQVDTVAYPFRALTIEDGLSQGMVTRILQDGQGFMWFATKDGLNRYDGYRFKVFRNVINDTLTIAENYVTEIKEDRNGRLWVGTSSKGLDVFLPQTEVFHHIRLGLEGEASLIQNITTDLHGNIWAASTKGLFKISFSQRTGKPVPASALPPYTVHRYFNGHCRISMARSGHLWGYLSGHHAFRITPDAKGADRIDAIDMAPLVTGPWNTDPSTTANGLLAEDPATGRIYGVHPYFIAEYDTSTLRPHIILRIPYPGGDRFDVDQVMIDEYSRLWIASLALWQVDLKHLTRSRIRALDPSLGRFVENSMTVFLDRNSTLWVGTTGYGLLLYDRRVERFNMRPDGSMHWMAATPDDRIITLRPDVCLTVFDPTTGAYGFTLRDQDRSVKDLYQGPPVASSAAVQDNDGTFWLCKGDLFSYEQRTARSERHPLVDESGAPIPSRSGSFPLYQEGSTALWFGTDSCVVRFDKATQRFRTFRYPIAPVHTPYAFVQAIHRDAGGHMWLATLKGLWRLDPNTGGWAGFQHHPEDAASIASDVIFSIHPDPNEPQHYLWLGTNGGGLNRFDMHTGRCERYTTKEGLPNDVVYGILDDQDGNLWMSTNKGLSRFHPSSHTFRNFNVSDGLQSDEFNRNAFCELKDGTLFFGGINGFNSFDPRDLKDDVRPIDVRITDIKLMNRSLAFNDPNSPLREPADLSAGMDIPFGSNMVTFEFAAMSFAAPERHQYQYMLKGFDPYWIHAGANNSAVYTNLDPGTYTFQVKAMNRDGIWNDEATTFVLVVRPPWWMAWWFFTVCVLIVGGGIALYIRHLRKQRAKLEMTVFMRTHELSREKDRSEELLKNILPLGVAAELKRVGHAAARHYAQVSVLFSDFKDFTGVCEDLTPTELVDELNVCFNAFDRIMEKYGIEKIKTIGDSYMAAGGVPEAADGMAASVVLAGLEMQAIMAERRSERKAIGRPSFDMRLGIHTGPVVAGIVGRRKFQYDIWGDTVNIASRMESTGEVGEVNISEATYALVRNIPGLTFIPRGRVKAKGKGELEMYFVRSTASGQADDLLEGRKAPTPAPARPQRRVPLKDLRILVAEDNSFNVMVVQDELESAIPGVVVDVARNGQEAVDMVIRNDYDLVLMDVQMPVMDGYQSTRAIRALHGPKSLIPIVALTANVMKAEVDRCMAAGMHAFIPKPFTHAELLSTLERVHHEPDMAR